MTKSAQDFMEAEVNKIKDATTFHQQNDSYCKTLLARYFNRHYGISRTRCQPLADAIEKLHYAYGKCDTENREKLSQMLEDSFGKLLGVCGAIEDMDTYNELSEEEITRAKEVQKTLQERSKLFHVNQFIKEDKSYTDKI
tara:strand:+ start:622 stop:1041 length:420 start_codon:yes stop_codon:yes gene_type:complete